MSLLHFDDALEWIYQPYVFLRLKVPGSYFKLSDWYLIRNGTRTCKLPFSNCTGIKEFTCVRQTIALFTIAAEESNQALQSQMRAPKL